MFSWNNLLIHALIILLFGCEDQEILKQNSLKQGLSEIKTPHLAARTAATSTIAVQHQLFAFQGDDLFRVYPNTREVEHLGSGWSGTEAATIYNNNIFAVQGGHLWRCNLTNYNCVDLGPDWEGTSFLTNDLDGNLYGIQGGKLWKVNSNNGSWIQLGVGEWGGSTELSFRKLDNSLLIQHGGVTWKVNRNNGTWIDLGTSTSSFNPLVTPVLFEYTYAISAGKLVYRYIGGGGGGEITSAQWEGASDIAWILYNDPGMNCGASYCNVNEIFILKQSNIHHLRKGVSPNIYSWNNMSPVPGLSNVYKIVSSQGL